MKRQLVDAAFSFPFTDMRCVRQKIMLAPSSKEVDTVRSLQANLVAENFPSDVWLHIFNQIKAFPQDKILSLEDFRFWLASRTVSKIWSSTISKIDFSQRIQLFLHPTLKPNKMLPLLRFSSLELFAEHMHIDDISLLTGLRSLGLTSAAVSPDQVHAFSQLTQLTDLKLGDVDPMSEKSLLCLTNLRSLKLCHNPDIRTISTLTNLHTLFLYKASITQEDTRCLTKLESLTTCNAEFFRSGKGKCRFTEDSFYEGGWLDGVPHGEGVFMYDNHDRYTGDWVQGKRHGKGNLGLWNEAAGNYDSLYEGDWLDDKMTGQGCRSYPHMQHCYTGSWQDGLRVGEGLYNFGDGSVYFGDWEYDQIHGEGVCKYKNGDVYQGMWKNGRRHGYGSYDLVEEGVRLEGQWEENNFVGVNSQGVDFRRLWGPLMVAENLEVTRF